MKTVRNFLLAVGAVVAFALVTPGQADAQIIRHRGYYPSYFPGSYYQGYYRSYRPHYHWHDTSHFDYNPGYYWRHGNHYHYEPPRMQWHQDGHWHRH